MNPGQQPTARMSRAEVDIRAAHARGRGLQLYTPRRGTSPWTRLNRERAAEMERRGLMTDAGRDAIAAAKATGWWTISDQVEDLVEPAELAAALDREPLARANWDAFPPSARKQMLLSSDVSS